MTNNALAAIAALSWLPVMVCIGVMGKFVHLYYSFFKAIAALCSLAH